MRGVLVTACSAALAVSAHAMANGSFPNPAITIPLSALIGWASTVIATRNGQLPGILATLGGGQLVTHYALTALSMHGHGHGGLAMTTCHVVATVLTAILLARAEEMLAVAAATLSMLLPVTWRPAPVLTAVPRRVMARPAGATTAMDVLLRRVHGRRGPPVLS